MSPKLTALRAALVNAIAFRTAYLHEADQYAYTDAVSFIGSTEDDELHDVVTFLGISGHPDEQPANVERMVTFMKVRPVACCDGPVCHCTDSADGETSFAGLTGCAYGCEAFADNDSKCHACVETV